MIRAFNPFPVAYFSEGKDRIRVWEAETADQDSGDAGSILRADNDGLLIACGTQALLVKKVQLPGKKILPIKDILNGHRERFATGQKMA